MANSQSQYERELAALKQIGSYFPYIGYAIQAYGVYQQLFGPAKKQIDWNQIIRDAESRIIDAQKKLQVNAKLAEMRAVSKFWTDTCVPFLRANPVSPDNVKAFDGYISVGTMNERLSQVMGLVEYFTGIPQEYATYGALVTANALLFTLMTTKETYFLAAFQKKTGVNLSEKIDRATKAIESWPEFYFQERASHLSIEIEEKYSGSGGLLGEGRQKHPTGWYILHDSAPDPATGSLEGSRYYRQFPNKVDEVRKRYQQSTHATEIVPQLLSTWRDLRQQAITFENSPLRLGNQPGTTPLPVPIPSIPTPRTPVKIDSRMWYRLRNLSSTSNAIDVVNDASRTSTDAQIHSVAEGNFSGQHWQFRSSSTSPGSWNMCTLFLGKGMCLDVYGNDKTRPHLGTAGNFTGQQWQVFGDISGCKLTNNYSGANLVLALESGSTRLVLEKDHGMTVNTQLWILVPIRKITEGGF